MPAVLKKLLRWTIGMACVAVLAVGLLLGVLRVLLPLAPQFQEEIAEWTSESLGYPVEFARMEPSWGLAGPQFRLRGVRIMSERGGGPLLLADEILVGVNLWTLWPGTGLTLDHMSIAGARLSLKRLGPQTFSIQGRDPAYYPGGPARLLAFVPSEILVRDVWIEYQQPEAGVRENLWLERLSVKIAGGRLVLDGRIAPPAEYGEWLGVGADIPLEQWTLGLLPAGLWRLHLEGRAVDLRKMQRLLPEVAALPMIGSGDFSLFVDLDGAEVLQWLGEVDFENLWVAGGPLDHVFDRLGGQFEWQRQGRDFVLTGARIQAMRGGTAWPDTELHARWTVGEDGKLTRLQLDAGFVRLEDAVPPLLGLAERAGVSVALAPGEGDLQDLSLDWAPGGSSTPVVQAEFSGVSMTWPARGLTLSGMDGRLGNRTGGGYATLEITGEGAFEAPWLDEAVRLTELQAELSWRGDGKSWTIQGDNLRLRTEGMDWAGRFSLALPEDGASPVLDLSGSGGRIADLPALLRRLPWKDQPGLPFGWLSRALRSGRGDGWNLQVSGPIRSLPFAGGVMRVEMDWRDAVLGVHEAWPDLEKLSGRFVLNGSRLVGLGGEGELAGVRWRGVQVQVRDLANPVVEVRGVSDDPLPRLLAGLARTPVADHIHSTLLNAETDGPARTRLDLTLPIADKDAWRMSGEIILDGVSMRLNALTPPAENLRGTMYVTRAGVRATDLRGEFLGQPLRVSVAEAPAGTAGYGYRVQLNGAVTASALQELFGCCALHRLSGEFAWQGRVLVPSLEVKPLRPLRVRLETDLIGLASAFPHPMEKPAGKPGPTRLELLWGSDGRPRLTGRLGLGPGLAMEFASEGEGLRLERARLHFGDSWPRLPERRGLVVDGSVDWLRPADWASLLAGEQDAPDLPWELELKAGEAYAMGSALHDQWIHARPRSDGWLIELKGEHAQGRVFWPRAEAEGAQLLAHLDRLQLTHPDPEPQPATNPRSLPAGKVLVGDLVLGDMRLGEMRARYEKTAGGLGVNWFRTESPAFSSEGAAAWLVTDEQGDRQLGRLNVVLETTDAAAALEQLGYAPGISADQGTMALSASWDGPPSGNFLTRANGTVSLDVRVGQVTALDPGGGRMLGVLSLARLPRRLALDFREITEDGLPFDRLTGDFSLRDGQAYTCNMGLQGAVAGLALFGRTGLKDRSYDQIAVVSPNLPDLLSLGGVIVGGTGLGATMLLLSQVFREPLQAISANYYRVSGSWDEPLVKRVLREEIDLEAFGDCARYLEERLTDMPDVDWDALLSKAEEEILPPQPGDEAAEPWPAEPDSAPADHDAPPPARGPSGPASSTP